MKRTIISLLLCAAMVAVLVGCGGAGGEGIVGKWNSKTNAGDALADSGLDLGLDFDVISVFEFKADGTYTFSVDMDSMKTSLRKMMEDMIKAFGMSLAEYEKQVGMSLDEMLDESIEEMDQMVYKGAYKEGEGKLYITDDLDEEIDEDYYVTYRLAGNKLTFTGVSEDMEGNDLFVDSLLPWEFTRK